MNTQTMVTKKFGFGAFVSAAYIYDAYSKDYAIQEAEREKELKKKMAAHMGKRRAASDDNKKNTYDQRDYNLLHVAKTVEKIISFNETEAIAQGKKKNFSKNPLKLCFVLKLNYFMFNIFYDLLLVDNNIFK